MLYKTIILLSLLIGSVTSKADNFVQPLVLGMYKTVYITEINKDTNQITTKESLSGKQKVYNYIDNNKGYFFKANLKNIKLNKKYKILINYGPDYDENGYPLQNAQGKYEKDEEGILAAVCEDGRCKF